VTEPVRFIGAIPNTPTDIAKLARRLANGRCDPAHAGAAAMPSLPASPRAHLWSEEKELVDGTAGRGVADHTWNRSDLVP
jgi:hypothetical protein